MPSLGVRSPCSAWSMEGGGRNCKKRTPNMESKTLWNAPLKLQMTHFAKNYISINSQNAHYSKILRGS